MKTQNSNKKNCDNCIHYRWYKDLCTKWNCEVDDRECHSCFEDENNRKEEDVHKD